MSAPSTSGSTRRGMGILALGVAIICLQDPIIKAVMAEYAVTEAIVVRSLAALPIFAALLWIARDVRAVWRGRPWILVLRGVIFMVSYTCYFLAFPEMPLANVVALYFTAPLWVVALSPVVLGERQAPSRWLAVAVGFAGAVVIAQPVGGGLGWAALLPLAAGAFYATGQLVARRVGDAASATVMSFHQNTVYLVGASAFALVASPWTAAGGEGALGFLLRTWQWPAPEALLLMALTGPIAVGGTILLTKAYREAPPGAVTTIEYTALLWAAVWGYLFFAEVPDLATVVGAVLIVGSGAYAMTRAAAGRSPA